MLNIEKLLNNEELINKMVPKELQGVLQKEAALQGLFVQLLKDTSKLCLEKNPNDKLSKILLINFFVIEQAINPDKLVQGLVNPDSLKDIKQEVDNIIDILHKTLIQLTSAIKINLPENLK